MARRTRLSAATVPLILKSVATADVKPRLNSNTMLAAGLVLAVAVLRAVAGAWEPPKPGATEAFPQHLSEVPLENVYRLTDRVYSGGEPRTDEQFAALARLGIKTVVSVDGAVPEVEAARRHGLAYIHLPMGYGGMPRAQQRKIVRALSQATGAVYFHCHHGKHRGPAAAAIACMASEGWTSEQGLAWLKQAGTSPDYQQLIRDVAAFQRPSAGELAAVPARLPERIEPPPMVHSMVEIDGLFDDLVAWHKSGHAPPGRNQRQPAETVVSLAEQFRELARSDAAATRNEEFRKLLSGAVDACETLRGDVAALRGGALTEDQKSRLDRSVKSLAQSCKDCHQRFRDGTSR
jgi:protein tyrosine phosphatase (PTP) superfamily phosphohydrolase (DUF442 family)